MACKYLTSPTVPDNMNNLLYVKRSVRGKTNYCGYKRDYLAKKLVELEREMLLCKVCEGIMRKASLVREETTCSSCSETPNQLNAVKLVDNCVNKLEIKCPLLKNCEWKGKLSEAETHLKECQHFLIECRDCNHTVTRGDMDAHQGNICLMRKFTCEYCNNSGKAKDYTEHLECCKKYPIKCPNECGKSLLRRELSDHNAIDCPLVEIDCPYAKYGCKASKMKRRDLLAHKKEYITEHMDMVETENHTLRLEMNAMKRLDGLRWEIKNVDKLKDGQHESPYFYVNNYKLKCLCRRELGSLNFTIQRIEGEHDRNLGIAFITECRVIIPEENGTRKRYNTYINHQLKIGTVSEVFYTYDFSNLAHICYIQDNALTILFYFDVNSSPSISQNFSRKTTQPINNDPFESQTISTFS